MCRAELRLQGGYERFLRHQATRHRMWVWRGYCRACDSSHALLPDFVVAHHLDTTDTIYAAVAQHRPVAVPASTQRGWRARFRRNRAMLASGCAATVVALGGDLCFEGRVDALLMTLWRAARRMTDLFPTRWRVLNIATHSDGRMGKLIYAINTSLDGFSEDATGSFDWSVPDEDVHEFYNDMMLGVGTQLLGRRMYETMAVWETDPSLAEESAILAAFAAAWQDSDKVVYSTRLTDPVTKRTRIVAAFDPDDVRAVKETSSADLLVGGPGLAAHALRVGLVDEIRLVLCPIAVGAGKPALPTDLRLDLELIAERRFGNGAVHVAYRVLR